MWYRSASFILDNRKLGNDVVSCLESHPLSPADTASSTTMPNENHEPKISLYYQTRAAHYGVVTTDWLAQAEAAVTCHSDDEASKNSIGGGEDSEEGLNVVDDFKNWRKQPDLAEAVAAIRALASVIRSSQATTMMGLEIELKKAADSLKVCNFFQFQYRFIYFIFQIWMLFYFPKPFAVVHGMSYFFAPNYRERHTHI